jgi:hypothetical protein
MKIQSLFWVIEIGQKPEEKMCLSENPEIFT